MIEIAESLTFFSLPLRLTQELSLPAAPWDYMMSGLGLSVFCLSLLATTGNY
jgi:hypothetical protein